MAEKKEIKEKEIKEPKTYSLLPSAIMWLRKRAAHLTLETGRRVSDSEVLRNAIEREQERVEKEKPKAGGR